MGKIRINNQELTLFLCRKLASFCAKILYTFYTFPKDKTKQNIHIKCVRCSHVSSAASP